MNGKVKFWMHWLSMKSLGRCDLTEAIKWGSSMNLRLILAVAATLYALLVILNPNYSWRDPSNIIKDHVSSLTPWAAMFALDAFCIWWRIFDTRPRVWWARIINIYTFALWFSLVAVTTSTLGYVSPDSTGEIIICLMAAWVAFRTDSTQRDKETA